MRHLTNFLPELGRQDSSREYVVLVRQSFAELDVSENVRLERVPDHVCSSWVKRIAGDVFELPRRLTREKFSATVSLTNYGPILSPVPHILFQRNALHYCPEYLARISGGLKIEMLLRRRLAVESMKRADLIVTPSNAMADMIRETCPEVRARRFKTLYHGFDSKVLGRCGKVELPLSANGAAPILFYPSHLAEYKGHRLLFEAVSLLKVDYPRLALILTIGPEDDPKLFASFQDDLRRLRITEHVRMVGRVPQAEIWELYRKSDLMVYPSYCESFGFSMLEAMGANLPIVAADTGGNREICDGAASYFSPFNAKECADRICEVLDNASTQASLRAAGIRRMATCDWSWRRYAIEFESILSQLGL